MNAPETALEWLRWPERIRPAARQHLPVVGALGPEARRALGSFLEWMRGRFPEWSDDDLDAEVRAFSRHTTTVDAWHLQSLRRWNIELVFWRGAPWLGKGEFARWAALTRRLDPDALITLVLARRDAASQVNRLVHWGTYITTFDPEIRRLVQRGVADTHIHLGGCDSVPLLWRQLMAGLSRGTPPGFGRRRLEQVQRYRPGLMEELSRRAPDEYGRRRIEMELIHDAARIRSALVPEAQRWAMGEGRRGLDPQRTAAGPAPHLREERLFLAWAWFRVLYEDRWSAAELGRLESRLPLDLKQLGPAELLDRYLFAKHRFLEAHYLGPEGNPGLRRFRRYLDQLAPVPPHRFRRFERVELKQRVRFAIEAEALERVELRIGPKRSLGEWGRFLTLWSEVNQEIRNTLPRSGQLDLLVHFLRPTRRPRVSTDHIPLESVRRRVAQRTAVLHLLRQEQPRAEAIVGIDVANVERDCPPEVFIPYLRLLRGDMPRSVLLDREAVTPWSRPWVDLIRRRRLWQPVDIPRLGLTFHAGESFYTPVQGLRFIHSAVFGLDMGPGDRLGHGLVLGLDMPRVLRQRDPGLRIPREVLLEDCVWLLYRLAPKASEFAQAVTLLRKWTSQLSETIFGKPQTVDVLWELHRGRACLPPPQHMLDSRTKAPWYEQLSWRRLWRAELFDEDCKRRAAEEEIVPEEVLELGGAIAAAQRALLADIARRRICVEVAPSSNFALGEMSSLGEHPYHKLVCFAENHERVIVSINTDDPGLFATRIENEYTLMAQNLPSWREGEAQAAMEEALGHLERARQDGLESLFRR